MDSQNRVDDRLELRQIAAGLYDITGYLYASAWTPQFEIPNSFRTMTIPAARPICAPGPFSK